MNDIVPAGNGADPITALLTRAATDPNFDAQKFEVAVSFIREREAKIAERAFNTASSAAQSEMIAVPRDKSNDFLRSRYATLEGMDGVMRPIYTKYGFGVRFGTCTPSAPGLVCVTCTVSHDAGHTETTRLEGPVVNTGVAGGKTQTTPIQAVGSTVTYLKRYLLAMVWNIVLSDEQDDDGEATRRRGQPTPPSGGPSQVQRPSHQGAAQGGTAGAQGAATGPVTNGQPADPSAWLRRLGTLLDGCKTGDDVAGVMARDAIKAWRDGASEVVRRDIDALSAAAFARVAPAESTPPASDALAALLAEIAQADQATLDALPTNAVFNKAVLSLSFPEQDRIDDAIKARAAALGAAQ